MSVIGDFNVGSVWMVTTECKRVAKVLSIGEETVWIPSQVQNQPPTRDVRQTVTVKVCTPSKPIRGHVTAAEADQNLNHRLDSKDLFGYDMWEEDWIDTPRERVSLSPKPKQFENDWIRVVTVQNVRDRASVHEAFGAAGKLGRTKGKLDSGTTIEAVLIPPEDVHPQLFEELGGDEKTQTQLNQEAHDKAVIAEYEKSKIAENKEKRRGPANESKEWGPSSKLKMQLNVCGIPQPDKSDGKFNERARQILSEYLNSIGINPWDIMTLNPTEFKEAVETARQKMPV